ncbi:MAG: FtsX-like permease family protein [Nocardioides sp.]
MPLLGPSGVLVDWDLFARYGSFNLSTTDVHILARGDTPPAVVRALGDRGLVRPQTESEARSLLDHDAFALALRLYTIVVLLVILLALAGLGANLAVQMPARRRDAASLRVVGMSKRTVVGSVVAEFGLVLGAAALAGLAAGALAQSVVINTVTLGFTDSARVPRTLPVLDIPAILQLAAALSVVLLAIAILVGAVTVRSARTSSLRENAR